MELMTRAVIVQRPIARTKATAYPATDRPSVAPNYLAFAKQTQAIDGNKLWAYVLRQWSPSMMDEMTIRVAIRTTARISFVLFLGAFLGDALYRLVPAAATRWLKANKDGFTLGFAGSHTVHLGFHRCPYGGSRARAPVQ
jgi:hypothetical protein